MERAKQFARQFFEQIGFHVDEIPETNEKRADLKVNDDTQQYIVEVKEKLDTGSQFEILHDYPTNLGHKIVREPHAGSDRIDGVLKSARKQLEATPAVEDALKLIFLAFTGPNADMFVRRTLYTFYGVQDVIPISEEGEGLNCVYFHNSFAFSSPNIDGLLLMENLDLQLCLNEFSAGCDVLRQSRLAQIMGMAVYDPATFGKDNGKIVLRSNIPRRDEGTVLAELERISGVRYNTITLHRYSL